MLHKVLLCPACGKKFLTGHDRKMYSMCVHAGTAAYRTEDVTQLVEIPPALAEGEDDSNGVFSQPRFSLGESEYFY